jgi:hypothetical protein
LQSAKPSLQLAMPHLDEEQAGTPLATVQLLPQLPQLVTLVVKFVSQPLLARPSQSPRPGEQLDTPHTPPTQLGVPPVAEQTLPQVLQLFTSVFVFVSQPLAIWPSQLA